MEESEDKVEDKELDLDVPEIVVDLKVPRIDIGEREDEGEEPEWAQFWCLWAIAAAMASHARQLVSAHSHLL